MYAQLYNNNNIYLTANIYLALTTCLYTLRVTQTHFSIHLTWVLDQLVMYTSWH